MFYLDVHGRMLADPRFVEDREGGSVYDVGAMSYLDLELSLESSAPD